MIPSYVDRHYRANAISAISAAFGAYTFIDIGHLAKLSPYSADFLIQYLSEDSLFI
jgi:hypothetical protein